VKHKSIFNVVAVAVTAAVFFCAGCGGGNSKPAAFVGSWVHYDGKDSIDKIELFKNGKGTVNGETSVSWKIENNRFVISSAQFGMSCDYDTSGSELTLINDNGDRTIFVKKESAKAFFKTGMKEKNAGNYDDAVTGFTEAVRLDSNFSEAYAGRAEAYLKKEDYDNAIADYTEVIRRDSNDIAVYLARVETYSKKKDYDGAIADLETILQKASSAGDKDEFVIAGEKTMSKKEFIKVMNERLEKNSRLNIDPRLIGVWNAGGECWEFSKNGTGWVGRECMVTNFKFTMVKGQLKFRDLKGCEGGDCWEGTPFERNFSFSNDGKTLILGNETLKKVKDCYVC
jgi:tetratricopeptide (TPR) repeat protein